jgi:hypothetical protein
MYYLFFYFCFFYLAITKTSIESIFDINLISSHINKTFNEKDHYSFYFHKKGVRVLKGDYLITKDTKEEFEIIVLLSCEEGTEIDLKKKQKSDTDIYWQIGLQTNQRFLEPMLIEKIEEKYEYEDIFGAKEIRFGTLYKVYWNTYTTENKQTIEFIRGKKQCSIPTCFYQK